MQAIVLLYKKWPKFMEYLDFPLLAYHVNKFPNFKEHIYNLCISFHTVILFRPM